MKEDSDCNPPGLSGVHCSDDSARLPIKLLPLSLVCVLESLLHFCFTRLINLVDTSLTTDASRKAILKAIARARRWYEQITTGQASNIAELATMHRVTPRFIRAQMRLVQLSPLLIESLMTKPELMPLSLDDLLTAVPMNWREQIFGQFAKSA